MGPVDLEIVLRKQSREYQQEELMEGILRVKLENPLSITLIEVTATGEGSVSWSEGFACWKHSRHNRETYLTKQQTFLQSSNGESLNANEYLFPFSISLPENLPESFELPKHLEGEAFVKYYFVATVRSTKNDTQKNRTKFQATSHFRVRGSLNIPMVLANIIDPRLAIAETGEIKSFSCFSSGKVEGTMTIDKKIYQSGENIKFTANIFNDSRTTLSSIRIVIKQQITLIDHQGLRRDFDSEVASHSCQDQHPVKPGGHLTLTNVVLAVPSTLPASKTIKILQIKYFAAVILGEGTGSSAPGVHFENMIVVVPPRPEPRLPIGIGLGSGLGGPIPMPMSGRMPIRITVGPTITVIRRMSPPPPPPPEFLLAALMTAAIIGRARNERSRASLSEASEASSTEETTEAPSNSRPTEYPAIDYN